MKQVATAGLNSVRRWFSGPTALEIMDQHRGTGPGFDLLRIVLSLLVILLHSFHTAYGVPESRFLATGWSHPIWAATLPIFFGLSGFLVAGSALRSRSLKVFLAFRALRIFPALTVEITLSALILGPLLTTVPISDYVSDVRFLKYFGNIIGWIHFELPGVFEHNPASGIVNKSLWTLHPELLSYVLMTGLMFSGIAYSRLKTTLLWVAVTIALAAYNLATSKFELHGIYGSQVLIYYFLTGILTYHWRHIIVINVPLLVIALAGAYVLMETPQTTFVLLPLVNMYIMVSIGMMRFPPVKLLQGGDYSYGLYLYAFPIQQAIVEFLPGYRNWWTVFGLAVAITFGVAFLSWHLIEKPALKLKRWVQNAPRPIPSVTEPSRIA
ncbi:acyltransferase [Streptomyces sp. AcH 505]|uniref:acyltransferase family protein n=1 Tax=Streptomyces sp. AcH 505 TaxID=352211 RepID=UPI00099D91AC